MYLYQDNLTQEIVELSEEDLKRILESNYKDVDKAMEYLKKEKSISTTFGVIYLKED